MAGPIPYSPDLEQPAPGEAATHADIIASMQRITATTFHDEKRALRAVHAKSHGLVEAELRVRAGLPPALVQGLFAVPGRYRTTMRLSTSPGDVVDDNISTPRGLALKVHGVPGEQLSGDAGDCTQDFLMVDAPAFLAADAAGFAGNLKLLAATTDRAEGLKKALSYVLQIVEAGLEAVGGHSGTLIALGGHPETHPLGSRYFTQVPIRFGDHVAKLSLCPVSPELTALAGARVDLSGRRDGLREAVEAHFAGAGGHWELRAQLLTDPAAMPIEDASVEWPEALSPYVAVADLHVAPQPAWDAARRAAIDDGAAFNPWHGLVAHRPLGGIMRARRAVYAALQGERSARSGCPFLQSA